MSRVWFFGLILAVFSLAQQARAGEPGASAWSNSDQGRVRLISAVTAVGDSQTLQLGVEFEMQPDWKIYWRSPGDAGYPPSIDWRGSENLADSMLSWPAPHRFSISGLETMGYKEQVVLPLVVRVNDPGQALELHAVLDYLTCAVVCVPSHADLTLELPRGRAEPSAFVHLISRFQARVPGDGARQGLSLVSVEADDKDEIIVKIAADPPVSAPDLFVERADQMQFSRAKPRLEQGGRRVTFKFKAVSGTGEGAVTDKPLVLTVVDGDRGMEVVSDVKAAEPGVQLPNLLTMMGIALLGGLILNLMPCVLPVLSLKVLALVSHGGASSKQVRGSFLATAAGIVASFLLLAAITSFLKLAGSAVGWGIQFQQPIFLCLMIALITLFAANLFGLFEIALPRFLADLGAEAGPSHGFAGHFATGAFATLLATPCSAPFLGTAVGFALAHGVIEIFSIFALLGIGMALPYLLVALQPKLAQRLPRPGRWMLTAKAVLGVLMLATGAWLVTVLLVSVGAEIAMLMAAVMGLSLLALALAHRYHWPIRSAVMAFTVIVAALLPLLGSAPVASSAKIAIKGLWKPFDPTRVAAEVAAGHVVFVDVTAEWCLTCQVNKATVVYRGDVAKRLEGGETSGKLLAMQADWTRPNEAIADYLASFGRYGIPFDAVYGPGAPDGIALPELLTEDAVLQALDQAGKPSS